jgi:hypothetical protein
MKLKPSYAFALALCILLFATVSSGKEKNTLTSPSAFFPENRFEFSPVVAGIDVTHTFILQNKGTVPLKIEKVRTGWGCTAVSYPGEVPPGGEGKIVIKVNTSGYGGRTLTKRITVKTNDPNKPSLYLTILGHVDKFVTIVPKRITLRGLAGNRILETVKVIPEKKYPFNIVGHNLRHGNNIRYEIEQVERSEGIEYVLTVENLKKEKGNYYNIISLKTDSKIQPLINIRVNGYILDNQPIKKK